MNWNFPERNLRLCSLIRRPYYPIEWYAYSTVKWVRLMDSNILCEYFLWIFVDIFFFLNDTNVRCNSSILNDVNLSSYELNSISINPNENISSEMTNLS